MKNSNIYARAKFSVAGLRHAWARERSFRTQILFSVAIFATLTWLQPNAIWWAIIIMAIASASAMEVLNGALEALIDRVHPATHPEVGMAKDMASAAAFIVNCATGMVIATMFLARMAYG